MRDPFLTIRDANGDIIVSNDDWNGTFDAKLFFTPGTTGHYFFETGSAFRYDTGAYALSLKFADSDDFGNSISDTNLSAGILSLDVLTTGEVQVPSDVDYFKIELEAGKNYQLDVKGLGGNAGTN